jgi:hypothetical protein
MDTVELQVSVRSEPGDETRSLAEHWLAGALLHLWPEAHEKASGDGEGERPDDLSRLFPAAPAAHIVLHYTGLGSPPEETTTLSWGRDSFQAFVERLASHESDGVLYIDLANNLERPEPISIRISPSEEVPEWIFFTIDLNARLLDHPDSASRILSFFKGFAHVSDPSYGQIAPMQSIHRSPLESLLSLDPPMKMGWPSVS